MSLFPTDDKARKMLPIFRMLTGYFPKAMRELTKICVVNNVRYNPGRDPADINWARGKSPDQLGSAFRHIFERQVDGKIFEEVPPDVVAATGIERVYVLAEALWRVGAALELDIEEQEAHGVNVAAAVRAYYERNPPLVGAAGAVAAADPVGRTFQTMQSPLPASLQGFFPVAPPASGKVSSTDALSDSLDNGDSLE